MLEYRLIKIEGENSPLNGKVYARPVIKETYDIERLARHMADHNTPFSAGVIKGVLSEMVACVKELVLDGKNVKLDNLGIFSVGIVSNGGAKSAEEFSVAKNVKGVKLRARATGDLSNANLNLEAVLREMPLYDGALEATTQAAA